MLSNGLDLDIERLRRVSQNLGNAIEQSKRAKNRVERDLKKHPDDDDNQRELVGIMKELVENEAKWVFVELTVRVLVAKGDEDSDQTYIQYLQDQLKAANEYLNAILNGEVIDPSKGFGEAPNKGFGEA